VLADGNETASGGLLAIFPVVGENGEVVENDLVVAVVSIPHMMSASQFSIIASVSVRRFLFVSERTLKAKMLNRGSFGELHQKHKWVQHHFKVHEKMPCSS
jgi:hypothetical protein